ncbi:rasGAP-activating-like protein 1 isoform X2 [Microcaecilia unicolor]|uniref:RasGAP-activating-like protein 1 isoform X2 n=1 Tax=Microcaecilia unicolor TaxID=1415580 RepID=A0A6P7ZEJ4_9AMPH|nr:rasGAP-activating-like protein 1 isoform X2 [Microcaecilia unicolor]
MARNTSLYFRVVEGRNLPAKDVSGSSDPYCIVKVDNEIVARTATVWRNLNPFWGEEYTLHLPMGFHNLAFYVMDEDTIGHDDVIGKISLCREYISSHPKGIDSWINLTRVDPDEEVQGEIYLELHVVDNQQRRMLHCHVLEARLLRRLAFHTGTRCWSLTWTWRQTRCQSRLKCLLSVWRSGTGTWWGRMTSWVGSRSPWTPYRNSRPPKAGFVCCRLAMLRKTLGHGWRCACGYRGKLGALRLTVRLCEDRILPSMYYQPLVELLADSIVSPTEEESITPLAMLEEVSSVESRQEVAMKLVKIFLGQGLAVPFLDYVNMREVTRTTDPNTLFRSNSLASKSMEQFMKVVGMPYLHGVLKPVINQIFEEKRYIELDPCKIDLNRSRKISFKGSLSEDQVRESSLELLKGYLSDIMDAIIGSVDQCPPVMRVAFKQLHKRVEDQFPEPANEDVKYVAISGYLFLRFFAPAILTPKLFNLRDHHADTRTSRSLLLLAKTVQSIGNLGLQLGHGKEQWMAPLHPFILQSISRVRDFLDQLIDVDSENVSEAQPRTLFHPSVTIKEGYLHKRKAEGMGLVTRFTFRKRYFWLSSETLSYSKSPDWQVRSSIPIQRICAVERVDENAFQQAHMMQIMTKDNEGQLHTMYIQCKNVNELNQWLSAIRKASIYNERMLPSCHPGAFRNGRWTCCLQSDRAVRGCSRTHSAVTLGDWSDPLDPDAEAQMVYRQLLLGRDKLRKTYLEFSDPGTAPEREERSCDISAKQERSPSFQDRRMAAAARLLDVIQDLERAHQAFERREREEGPNHSHHP